MTPQLAIILLFLLQTHVDAGLWSKVQEAIIEEVVKTTTEQVGEAYTTTTATKTTTITPSTPSQVPQPPAITPSPPTPPRNLDRLQQNYHDEYYWSPEKNESFVPVPIDLVNGNSSTSTSTTMEMAEAVTSVLSSKIHTRLEGLFNSTRTPECRQLISEAYGEYLGAIGGETPMPFSQANFESECPHTGDYSRKHSGDDSNKKMIDDPTNLNLLYVILTHKNPSQTIRLISALSAVGHSFVIHVDSRASSNPTHIALVNHYLDHPLVHVVPDSYRVSVNWGGFSIVQATLNAIKYGFGIGRDGSALDFHKVVSIASTSYPLVSNSAIRKEIAKYPLDMNLVEIRPSPNTPSPHTWHYFVECDEKVHRIYRLPLPPNIDMYVGSQWFVISREVRKKCGIDAAHTQTSIINLSINLHNSISVRQILGLPPRQIQPHNDPQQQAKEET